MLLSRSAFTQLLLIAAASIPYTKCQQYDSDYRSDYDHDGGGDDHSGYNEGGSDGVDYSKYYSVDSSAPLIQSKTDAGGAGFVNPIEFSGFFGPSNFEFGASNTQEVLKPNFAASEKPSTTGFVSPHELQSGFAEYRANSPFGARDYFEDAQKQQNPDIVEETKDHYETKPGPSYISHQIVAPTNKRPSKKYESEITELNKSHKYNPYKTVTKDINDDSDDDKDSYQENKKTKSYDFVKQPYPTYPVLKQQSKVTPLYTPQYNPINKPFVSQSLQLNPQPSNTKNYKAELSPYEKYSFQPSPASTSFKPYNPALQNSYDKYSTTVPNYEYAPSEYVAKLLTNQECKKVDKNIEEKDFDGRIKRQAMNCYTCKDAKSGVSYEQCSYGTLPNSKPYYLESDTSKKTSIPEDTYRFKRYTVDETKDDPYEYVKSKSQEYYSKPEEFESDYYNPKEYKNEEYRFGPEYFDGGEKSSSEKESDALVKNGENCKKVNTKDGMTCMVCKNAKTGGSYEQCSYSSEPAEKKYAYVRERKYNSDDENEEEPEGTEEKPVRDEKGSYPPKKYGQKRREEKGRRPEEVEEVEPINTRRSNRRPNNRNERYNNNNQARNNNNRNNNEEDDEDEEKNSKIIVDTYEVPKHFEEDNKRNKAKGAGGVDSELYGSAESSNYKEKPLESPYNDDQYYYKHFPEYKNEESKQTERKANPDKYDYYAQGSKDDVEEVLAEFAKKDRSKCQKAEKNGMTCYKCIDAKGLQHEECMYVSESKPQSTYASYHAQAETEEPKNAESKKTEVSSPRRQSSRIVQRKSSEPITSENKRAAAKVEDTKTNLQKPLDTKTNTSKPPRQFKRTKNISQARPSGAEQVVEESKVVETTDKYKTEGKAGAFEDETKPVYSKKHGFTLPKYMLTKSEGENEYDEFVKGRKLKRQ